VQERGTSQGPTKHLPGKEQRSELIDIEWILFDYYEQ
jgi:hypothetical protein